MPANVIPILCLSGCSDAILGSIFHRRSFLYFELSAEDPLEVSRFSAWVLPYLHHYSAAFAFSRILYLLNVRIRCRLLTRCDREFMRLTEFPVK